jgi:rubrerythrin
MTKENLKAAFSGEIQAHMKYLIFADKAEGEGSYVLLLQLLLRPVRV